MGYGGQVQGGAVSHLQEHLAGALAKKVQRDGLVVWDDPDAAYLDVANSVSPPGVPFLAYEGSWFALRRSIEPYLSSPARQSVVVYIPVKSPAQDPLEEVRQAGKTWSIPLRTLLATALKGEVTTSRIGALSKQARTLAEVEAVLESGGAVDARLVAAFSTADLTTVAASVLSGGHAVALEDAETRSIISDAMCSHFGGSVDARSAEQLRASLFRTMTLNTLRAGGVILPEAWTATVGPGPTLAQLMRCQHVLNQLMDARHLETQRRLGEELDRDLSLRASLQWSPGLADVDSTPGIEDLAFAEALRLLGAGDYAGAECLAEQRLRLSRWARVPLGPATPDHPHRKWRALSRIAVLHRLLLACRLPEEECAEGILEWYATDGWRVDRAHRMVELARVDLGYLADLDTYVTSARQKYESWIEEVVSATTRSVAAGGLDVSHLQRQADIYGQFVAVGPGKTAYVLVDALRLELGHAVVERLGLPDSACGAAVASVPTITAVGMAGVLPDARDGIALDPDGDAAVPMVAGVPVRGVGDRVAMLGRHAGDVLDIDFTDLVGRSDAQLQSDIDKADLVLVRSTDIDAAGESGRLGTAWRTVDGILDDLVGQLLRLSRLGVTRSVVTSDHGFLALSQQLSSGRVLDRPSAGGALHRRCWIGTGGTTPDGAVRVPLAELGIGGGLDLVVPVGLAVFPCAGSRQFFHGGLSPQELMIPVINVAVALPEPSVTGKPKVEVTVAGKGITTGVFAATLTFGGDLFTKKVELRVLARLGKDSKPVARLVAGDGFDPGSGTVTVGTQPAVLTFQVTTNLDPSRQVELHVLDARTGVELLRPVKVPVVAPINVEEDWT
jgi:hypothetical protein